MKVSLAAGNDGFIFYKSGILTSSECPGSYDHAVVLVGYEPAKQATVDSEIVEQDCRKRRWKDMFYENGCRYADEYQVGERFCCWDNKFVQETN